jgi:hypothetical protein
MSDTLALATRLRSLDDEALAAVIRHRAIRPTGIKDVFDLADALLDRASVQLQLARLDRSALTVIAVLGQVDRAVSPEELVASLREHGSVIPPETVDRKAAGTIDQLLAEQTDDGVRLYRRVAEQIASWPAFGLPGLDELVEGAVGDGPGRALDVDRRFIDRLAADRAFAATTEVSDLLFELEREPARELAKGGIALPDTKRLAHVVAVDLERVPQLVAIARSAGLVARESGSWLITDEGGAWLLRSSADRWRDLAAGWLDQVTPDAHALLAENGAGPWGESLARFVARLYPAGGERIERIVADYERAAELLGITANATPSRPGVLLLVEGPTDAAAAMAELLPAEVGGVYLQNDLSIVSPGPLAPEVDYRLRSLADVESRALASTYRVSPSSMNRAMASGESADSVHGFLRTVSLSGIPQPLSYLINEAATRYGLLRAGELDAGPSDRLHRTYLSSTDAALLATVLVDQSLSGLGLGDLGDGRLGSRMPLDTVFWAVSDARYPVAAEDRQGGIVALRRRRHARPAAAAGSDPVDELVARLRLEIEAEPSEPEEAWLLRQLDAAIRSKESLTVSVTMPNGSVVDYELEPTSVAGGRLRARDSRSAIERTLPLSSIAAVRAAPVD